jgi:hypothetical protein
LDRIEAKQQTQALPQGIRALELLQMVYRGEFKASAQQMRAAIEALPYEQPKLTAVAFASIDPNSFARALDRAIERSSGAKLIEARAIADDERR